MNVEELNGLLAGLSKDGAEAALKERGMTMRVVREDKEEFMVTMDWRDNRVNVEVDQGEVTRVREIG